MFMTMCMINDFLFDILWHVSNAVSCHIILPSTSPTHPLLFLRISTITPLRMPPTTLASPPQLFTYRDNSARFARILQI